MKKINDLILSNNEEVTLVLRLSNIVTKKTTSGDDYASMIGFDGVDKIEAKIWNFSDDFKNNLVNGEVYKVLGRTKQYQNRTQLNILSLEKVSEEDNQSNVQNPVYPDTRIAGWGQPLLYENGETTFRGQEVSDCQREL